MKKILHYILFLMITIGYSQSSRQIIQKYVDNNLGVLKLSSNEADKWIIGSETTSESMEINNCLVYQTYNGIKIDNPQIYCWIKNNKVINKPAGFITNFADKVNASIPVLGVQEAFSASLSKLNESNFTTSIIEKKGNNFKLTNGILVNDPVRAELVYSLNDENNLILTWNFEYYSQSGEHLWKTKINALNGNLIEKYDLVLTCNFGSNHNHQNCNVANNKFTKVAMFKESESANLFVTPGTTNYRVLPWNIESPNHGSRQLIANPEATTVLAPATTAASPNGWHNESTTIGATTTTFNVTRGNNVSARDDFFADNVGLDHANASSGTYPSVTFDFPYQGNGVDASNYINASITNLFYMNNVMHDLWYQYGFNEANRNFQKTNYGRGARGDDAVNADAQDAGGINNANFATPADGAAPRMQMFLWNNKKPTNLVVNTGSLAGIRYFVNDNSFNPGNVPPPVAPSALTGDLVLFNDNFSDPSDACSTSVNPSLINGKIAVIRRGSCNFSNKVINAQNAGAIGVVIVNNTTGAFGMTGTDGSIMIPAVAMTQANGEALITAMAESGNAVNVSISDPEVFVNSDGSFDNGIIAHEYGHGISTRLVGGGAGLSGSAEQPGEGWSDWFWLMMQIKPGDTRNDARGIGTFVSAQETNGRGIRQYRYSTDMSVNPHTFGDTNSQVSPDGTTVSVHGVGSIWCVMLWDLAWNYIDKYGYDSNIYNGNGGNNKLMRLVMDGMKLTPASPTLIECRNAIIQADQNTTGGENYCLIWKTFARRGMGVNASSGGKSGVAGIQDQVEDFTEPAAGPNCTATLSTSTFNTNELIKVYPNPSRDLITLQINEYAGKLNIQLFDINGRVVLSLNNKDFSNEISIDISRLDKGIYLLKVEGEDLSHTNKVIKN